MQIVLILPQVDCSAMKSYKKKDPMKDLKQEGKSIRKAFLFDPVV